MSDLTTKDDEEVNLAPEGRQTAAESMSKNQLKKLKKRQEYLIKKFERRLEDRQKKKLKRAERLAKNEDLGPTKKQLKLNTMKNSQCQIKVAIDCSFDDLMSEKDIMKFGQQLQYCYARNRRATNPMQFHIINLEKKTLARLDQIGFYKSWDVTIDHRSYLECFKKEDVVYLTSDSSNILNELSPEKVYIIGGLVDHNHHKGLCYKLATENNIDHAQLPIGQFLQLASRNVLAVNHVFEILLKFTETKDWKEAFYSVIPKRKLASKNEKQSEIPVALSGDEHLKNNDDSQDTTSS